MKWDDVDYLMQKRKSQGFTVLQIVALDPELDVLMRNPSGDAALLNDDLSTPNEKYFEYLDWIINKAEEYGFYVLLLPVWGQLVVGDDWVGGVFPKTVTEENAYGYGAWIGNRYKEKNHILWCLGGDRQPVHKGVDYLALQSEGAGQMKYLREIMEDLQLMTCLPASGIVVGQDGSEDMNSHVAVSEDIEGRFICSYLPSGGGAKFDLSKLPTALDKKKESLYLWWWNPSDGRFYDQENQQTETAQEISVMDGSLSLASPTEGEEKDWVLILMTEDGTVPVKDKVYYELEQAEEDKVFEW